MEHSEIVWDISQLLACNLYSSKESNSAYWHGKVEMIETNQTFDISISFTGTDK